MTPALIAIDWGTSSFRAWALDPAGEVLAEVPSGPGILAVPGGDFEAAFESAVGAWLAPGVPVIASGMITSRNGWVETPYLPLPCGAGDLAAALTPHRTASGHIIHFVTGAMRPATATLPDVMRGEETEIVGHVAGAGEADGLFVLPGTHSKWASVAGGRITDFRTVMTGEAFALLRRHSILGRLAVDGPPDMDAFARGLAASGDGAPLLARAFSARALPLMGQLDPGGIGDYLSGLLIGDEVAGMLAVAAADGGAPSAVTIIGRGDLTERYRLALGEHGLAVTVAAPGMARAGLRAIAAKAGLTK